MAPGGESCREKKGVEEHVLQECTPGGCRAGGGQAKEGRHGVGETKNRTSTEAMREWSGTESEKRQACRFQQTFGRCPALGRLGQADWAGGAAWLQAAGYAAQGRPGCQGAGGGGVQGTGRGWPLTLDLQDLVAEVGLEVEGAVGGEHEPQAAGSEGRRSLPGRGGHLGTPTPRPWSRVETQAVASPPLTPGTAFPG